MKWVEFEDFILSKFALWMHLSCDTAHDRNLDLKLKAFLTSLRSLLHITDVKPVLHASKVTQSERALQQQKSVKPTGRGHKQNLIVFQFVARCLRILSMAKHSLVQLTLVLLSTMRKASITCKSVKGRFHLKSDLFVAVS